MKAAQLKRRTVKVEEKHPRGKGLTQIDLENTNKGSIT